MAELATLPENRSKLKPGTVGRHRRHGRRTSSARSTPPPSASIRRPSSSCRARRRWRRCSTWPAPSCAGPSATPSWPPTAVARRHLPEPPVRSPVDPRPLAGGSLASSLPPVGAAMTITFDTAVTRPRTADVIGIPRHRRRARAPRRPSAGATCELLGFRGALGSTGGGARAGLRRPRRPRRGDAGRAADGGGRTGAGVVGRRRWWRPSLADVDGVDPRARGASGGRGLRARLVPVPRAEAQRHAVGGRARRAARAGGVGDGPCRGAARGAAIAGAVSLGPRPGQHARPAT